MLVDVDYKDVVPIHVKTPTKLTLQEIASQVFEKAEKARLKKDEIHKKRMGSVEALPPL